MLNLLCQVCFSYIYIRWNRKIVVPLQPETPLRNRFGPVMY